MGNNTSRDTRSSPHPGASGQQHQHQQYHNQPHAQQSSSSANNAPSADGKVYAGRNAGARGSRPDLSFLHIGRDRSQDPTTTQRPRETKQEREARRAERDRQARVKERERSMREESVDGGYLVTLGTYTGTEDFSKPIVRQLQIERRVAPFWRGLNDHDDSWTEAQLVAAARGLPIPAPDEIPPEMARTASQMSSEAGLPTGESTSDHLAVPGASRTGSYQADASANLSASHPAFSTGIVGSQLLRGRAKTFVSLASGKNASSSDLVPQEIRLPRDPYVNGQPLEAHLYQNASECPICFLYYPPYLNRTRCCDQPICSECFVQIKRPDPHPPEHEQPGQARPPEEETEFLVSEVAACPFCVTPEFGVTYDPPPFRRGLAYANSHPTGANPYRNPAAALSSSSSLPGAGRGETRRRATSLSANAPNVVTTDRVRPDWASKLADARAHALRRSAAATALHNAAYVLGNNTILGPDSQNRAGAAAAFALGRRRRTIYEDSPNASGTASPGEGGGNSSADLVSGRSSSRRNRVEDLEDLMMMEAIRLSLAAEEERKRKEEKEAQREEKKKAKDARKADKKLARKSASPDASTPSLLPMISAHGGSPSGSRSSSISTAFGTGMGGLSMSRSSSQVGTQPPIIEEDIGPGKGKQPLTTPGTDSSAVPTSTPSNFVCARPTQHTRNTSSTSEEGVDADEDTDTPSSLFSGPGNSNPSLTALAATTPSSDGPPAAISPDALGEANTQTLTPHPHSQQDSSPTTPLDHRDETPVLDEPLFNFRSLAALIDTDPVTTAAPVPPHSTAKLGSEHLESVASDVEKVSQPTVETHRPNTDVDISAPPADTEPKIPSAKTAASTPTANGPSGNADVAASK